MDNLVTVVMPVYNAEKYLYESIGSVLVQDFSNWELICVDDGSTDNSFLILKEFEELDSRIKILKQKNSGPAAARKKAIAISAGDYLLYLDTDDCLSPDYITETLKVALKTNADVVMPELMMDYKSKIVKQWSFNDKHGLNKGLIIEPREAFIRTFPWTVHGLNLYKAQHIKKYALSKISDLNNYNADEYLTRFLLLFANKIVVSKGIYYYRANNINSITRSFSLKKLGAIKTCSALYTLAKENNFNEIELSYISNDSCSVLYALKLELIEHNKSLSKKDSYASHKAITMEARSANWTNTLNLDTLKMKIRYTVIKLPRSVSISLYSLYKFIKHIRISLPFPATVGNNK